MLAFDRMDKSTFKLADTLRWERRYVAGSLVAAFLLGTVCGHALVVAQDPFAELVTISVTLATMISVVGRNFGSRLNVDMIILAACLPIMAGLGDGAGPLYEPDGCAVVAALFDNALDGQWGP
jgi:Na+/citrate or Na+/malate symporter